MMLKARLGLFIITSLLSCNTKADYHIIPEVPDLVMPENGLKFKTIEDYKIVATHYVTDNNELRYILANQKALGPFLKTVLFQKEVSL